MDPRIISLDIESYGACVANHTGHLLPEQTVFNPLRSMHTDGVSREDLILTVAVTLPKEETCISNLEPADTMVFKMHIESHRRSLALWLKHADTIVGMNLQFDIQYLRQIKEFKYLLDGRQTLIDLSVVNYLHSELRPEKSLKALGPVLGTHSYKDTLKDGRFTRPDDSKLLSYNAQDTHNTLACVSEIAKRIQTECLSFTSHKTMPSTPSTLSSTVMTSQKPSSDPTLSLPYERHSRQQTIGVMDLNEMKITSSQTSPPQRLTFQDSTSPSWRSSSQDSTMWGTASTDKLSAFSIQHYSDTIWSCIQMSEAGIPMQFDYLHRLQKTLELKCKLAASVASSKFDLILEGQGSAKSKQTFLDTLIEEIDKATGEDILSHPLLSLTPKTKQISWSEDNRNLLSNHLPQTHPLQQAIRLVKYHAASQKLISSYVFPLLHHRRNRPKDKSSVLIPLNKKIGLAHPTWYIVPSLPKDTGSEGGTIQGRITCKSPSAQTFPPQIKKAMHSRWSDGVILGFDLSQIELRVAALLSGDKKLLASYNDNLDLHTDRTLSVFGQHIQDEPDFKNKWRQIGKTLNFADLFLASAPRMQRTVVEMCGELMPIDFFKNIVQTRYDQRPGLTEWQYELCCAAEQYGYIALPFTGQSRTFTSFEVDKNKWYHSRIPSTKYNPKVKSQINEVVNFPIQTTAGNVLLHIQHQLTKRLPSLNKVGPRPMMFLQIYDAVYFDCPTKDVDNLNSIIQESVDEVVGDRGYWGNLQQLFRREVPLLYETEIVR